MKGGIKINASDILNFLEKDQSFNYSCTLGVSEFCPYGEGRRIDMFYFNRWNRETKGYEIKVSREDFLQDKKWESYLKFCTWFYFVAPAGIIKPNELPEGIGLIEIDVKEEEWSDWEKEHDNIEEDQKKLVFSRRFAKRAKRLHDVADADYISCLEGMLVKIIYEKNLLKLK